MDKELALEIIKLLSALESWCFSTKERLPDHTLEKLNEITETLTNIVLDNDAKV